MAQTYYLDFNVMLFATKVVEAESYEQAVEIAEKLGGNDFFWHEELLPMFREAEILPENLDSNAQISGCTVDVFEDDERFMTADQIAEYIGE